MSGASCFLPAIRSSVSVNHLRSSPSETSKKRKRGSTAAEVGVDGQLPETSLTTDHPRPSGSPSIVPAGSLTASRKGSPSQDVAMQYEISGQLRDADSPGRKFPHASPHRLKESRLPRAKSSLTDELLDLRPPLCVAASPSRTDVDDGVSTVGLRRQHLAALTAIIHKCLLQGDYDRAGRAWGMLLRAEHGGHSLDLRTNGRWGLGAEILLQRHARLSPSSGEAGGFVDDAVANDQYPISRRCYSIQGIEQAKDYYERLVLQYPYSKAFPNRTDPQDFYMAMFGLWIYSAQVQHSLAIADIEGSVGDGEVDAIGMERGHILSVSDSEPQQHRQADVIRQDTLQRAHGITNRLKELLNSPPYSDNARFWELLGMVHLWVGDLSITTLNQAEGAEAADEDMNASTEDSSMSSSTNGDDFVDSKRNIGQVKGIKAHAHAQKAFDNARLHGAGPSQEQAMAERRLPQGDQS